MHRKTAGNVQGHRSVASGVSKKTLLYGHGGSQVVRKGHVLSSGNRSKVLASEVGSKKASVGAEAQDNELTAHV